MTSIEVLLGIICTESIEDREEDGKKPYDSQLLPPTDYRLELVEDSNGNYEWIE